MDIEVLNNLENKITSLLSVLDTVRQENSTLKNDLEISGQKIATLETENTELKNNIEQLKEASVHQQEKLDLTAEKIQGILSKLEMVQ